MDGITPKVSVRAFKSRLAGAKRRTRFLYGRELAALADDLRASLLTLAESLEDTQKGVETVADFFRSDEALFNMCDDSDGTLGDLFVLDARDLFVHYATKCDDKKWLADLVLDLQRGSDYGVRDCLIHVAAQYLPEPVIRDLIEEMWALSRAGEKDHDQRHWLYLIESLARQIHDPGIFKKAAQTAWPEGSVSQSIDIAEVYFESGDAKTALQWLNKIPLDEHFQAGERDELLLAVYRALGKSEEAAETAWRIFRGFRHEETFEQLLEVTGSKDRERLLDAEAELILKSPELSYTDAEFLIWCGKVEDAETYLLSHVPEIDGGYYGSILPLAEAMEHEERYLAATVLYRALLESILARAISKYYGYGVRYLHKLDELAPWVRTWKKCTPHDKYFSQLVEKHKRKSSFWGRYEAKRSGQRKNKSNRG